MKMKPDQSSKEPGAMCPDFMAALEERLEKGRKVRHTIVSSHLSSIKDGILGAALHGYGHYDHSLMGMSPGYYVAVQKAVEDLGVKTKFRLNPKTGGVLRIFLPD